MDTHVVAIHGAVVCRDSARGLLDNCEVVTRNAVMQEVVTRTTYVQDVVARVVAMQEVL